MHPSDALYPPEDLRLGERLLVACGLVAESDGYLYPTEALHELAGLGEAETLSVVLERAILAVPAGLIEFDANGDPPRAAEALARELGLDPERREALLLQLARRHSETEREALGRRGEEFVVALAQAELADLGRDDLAAAVRHLSQFTDELGYDVVAPRIGGTRRLEVKTCASSPPGTVRLYLSRGEFDWGLRDPDWAIVSCRALAIEIELIGWCRASTLEPYLPIDGEGRWVSAEITVPETLFRQGLPPIV